jgi:hypothetical protein
MEAKRRTVLTLVAKSLYDAMYIVKPLKDAMCTTNSATGNSCMLEIAGSTKAAAGGNNATVPADGKCPSTRRRH